MTDVDKLYLNMNINVILNMREFIYWIISNKSKFNSWKLLLPGSHRSRWKNAGNLRETRQNDAGLNSGLRQPLRTEAREIFKVLPKYTLVPNAQLIREIKDNFMDNEKSLLSLSKMTYLQFSVVSTLTA